MTIKRREGMDTMTEKQGATDKNYEKLRGEINDRILLLRYYNEADYTDRMTPKAEVDRRIKELEWICVRLLECSSGQ